MFEQEDLVWAVVGDKPVQMSVIDPYISDGMCRCFVPAEQYTIDVPTDCLYKGTIPDDYERYAGRKKTRLPLQYDDYEGGN